MIHVVTPIQAVFRQATDATVVRTVAYRGNHVDSNLGEARQLSNQACLR